MSGVSRNVGVFDYLHADSFSIGKAYSGNFEISGNLLVNQGTIFRSDITVNKNQTIDGDLTVKGNANLISLQILGFQSTGNATINGTTTLNSNVFVNKSLIFNPNKDIYMHGNNSCLGINTVLPAATLDIKGNISKILNVYSNLEESENTLVQNRNNRGITLFANTNISSIKFYNDNSIDSNNTSNADIKYLSNGNLQINTTNNTSIMSNVSIQTNKHVFNESLYVNHNTSGNFLSDHYLITQKYGNSMTLGGNENKSVTFLNIVSPNLPVEPINEIQGNIISLQGNIISIGGNAFSIEGNLISLQGTSITVQGNLFTVQGNINIQGNIFSIKDNLFTLSPNIITVQGNLITVQGNIMTVQSNIMTIKSQENIITLQANITTLQGNIDIQSKAPVVYSGLSIGAGTFPNDQTRSMSTFGFINKNDEFVPSQVIISGNNRMEKRSTVGINKYTPITDKYVLDINGPVHISNGQISVSFYPKTFNNISNPPIQENTNQKNIIFVGNIVTSTTNLPQITDGLYYSKDGGQSWNPSIIYYSTSSLSNNFDSIYSFDNSYSIISSSERNIVFYTSNGGETWEELMIGGGSFRKTRFVYFNTNNMILIRENNLNISSIQIAPVKIGDNYKKSITNESSYIELTNLIVDTSIFNSYKISVAGIKTTNPNVFKLFIAYSNKILPITFETDSSYRLVYHVIGTIHTASSGKIYNAIYTKDNNIIAVGVNIISYSNDGGNSFNNINFSNTFNSVYIVDDDNAIAVGNAGTIKYTTNKYQDWIDIPTNILNSSGNSFLLKGESNDLLNIIATDQEFVRTTPYKPNTFIITTRTSISPQYKLLYCYFPYIFNSDINVVLDIDGGVRISDNVNLERNVKINKNIFTNDIHPYSIDANIPVLNIGTINKTKNICIGSTEHDRIDVTGLLSVYGNVGFGSSSICTFGNAYQTTAESTSASNGQLIVFGGVGISANINIGGNAKINSNVESTEKGNGALVVLGGAGIAANINIGGNAKINSIIESTDKTNGALVVLGGAGIAANLYIGGNAKINSTVESTASDKGALVVLGGAGIAANLYIGGNTKINSTVESIDKTNGALVVLGGAGIAANINIGGNAKINSTVESTASDKGSLVVLGGAGIGANLYIGGNAKINSTVESTDKTNGALVVLGGAGIAANINIGGNAKINSIIESTASDKGALVVLGGAGIAANINIGGNAFIEKDITVTGNIDCDNYITANESVYVTKKISVGFDPPSTSSFTLDVSGNIGSNSITVNTTTDNTSSVFNVNNGTINTFTIKGTGGIEINENTGSDATVNSGSLVLKHMDPSGVSSIVFVSKSVESPLSNTDFGYIKFKDNLSQTADSRLIIGIENDANTGVNKDSIVLYTPGGYGFVGINNLNPTTSLDVSGSVTISGTVQAASYNAVSDYRIKSNVISLNETHSINNLEPKYYYNEINGKYEFGFIAHELEKEYPFLVNGKKDDDLYQSINYNGIIGLLTNEIKILKKEMNLLKEEMRTLRMH